MNHYSIIISRQRPSNLNTCRCRIIVLTEVWEIDGGCHSVTSVAQVVRAWLRRSRHATTVIRHRSGKSWLTASSRVGHRCACMFNGWVSSVRNMKQLPHCLFWPRLRDLRPKSFPNHYNSVPMSCQGNDQTTLKLCAEVWLLSFKSSKLFSDIAAKFPRISKCESLKLYKNTTTFEFLFTLLFSCLISH